MLERLRRETGAAHARLEANLALLEPPLSRARFTEVLAGFRGFHAAWEPRVETLVGEPAFTTPRRKLALLDGDLATLRWRGEASAPGFDLAFLEGPAEAWGSLYVMEGSTLGGKVISKALAGAPWSPPGGLRYFDPYGSRTGEMWTAFRAALEGATAGLDPDRVVAGAKGAFAALDEGLTRRLERAA